MAAVCWGAWAVAEINPQAVVIVLPADAHITDVKKFKEAILEAVSLAQNKKRIVCLGIKPTFAATGYGYIQNGEPLQNGHTIARFIEKPPVEKAAEYFETGEYTWNAGIFVFNVSVLKEEVREHSAEFAKFFDENVLQPKNLKSKYKSLPKISVDVALMEKSRKGAVVKGDFGWNDIGSWRALEEVLTQGPEGVLQTPGGHLALDCEGLIVNASPGKFVGLIGLKDLIIVETKDALLVCPKERAEQVKDLVGLMEKHSKWKKRL
jgi:mannose-1-phosphate guanylyltransferase